MILLLALLPLAVVLRLDATSAQEAPPRPILRGTELAQALRAGGYVIYFRHATTDAEQADTDRASFERCDTQRNLSAEGRKMASDIGRAFKALGIRVGIVLSSPYCRAKDTADLAFGGHKVSDALYFAVGADKPERARLTGELRRLLATPPGPRLNTVIISHNANLKEATGIWPKREGDAHVFRPKSGGQPEYIGEAEAGDWPRWARELAAEPSRPGSPRSR